MAGGSGTRLWPASSSKKPKQFLPVSAAEKESFFYLAVKRALALIDTNGRVIIITGYDHIPHVIEACSSLSAAEKKHLVVIPEPEAKNTAPAVACAVMYSDWASGDCDRNMLVLTSDHIIQPLATFLTDASAATAFAQQDKLAVFGIPPSKPETGYGYIETGKQLTVRHSDETRRITEPITFAVEAFTEKPDRATAEKFVASKRFYWNSGMFAFSTKFIMDEYRRLARDVIQPFQLLRAPDERSYTVKNGLRILTEWLGLDKAYNQTKIISFDYAIAEKCSQVVMIRAGFDWIDVGNWEEYARLLGDTGSEVYISGGESGGESAGKNTNFVDSDIPVALAGVDDLIVVIRSGKNGSPPVALITKKGETQHVRHIVEHIKKAGKTELL
jgi:mannose-1-phosphate guanylyltransferase/mannose-1-phosphate guanylyltransferase/mannose-6-phosphate isomerase